MLYQHRSIMIKVGDASSRYLISKTLRWIVPYGIQECSVGHNLYALTCIQCAYFNIISDVYMFYFITPSGMGFISCVIYLDLSFTKIIYDDLKPFRFPTQSHAIQISSRRVKRFTSWTILKCNWTVESINGWIPKEGSIQGEWCMGCEFLKQ